MLSFLYKKMMKNKWLVISLLIGFITATSIITAVPMYTSSIFKKILATDLEKLQKVDNIFPGIFTANKKISSGAFESKDVDALKNEIKTSNLAFDSSIEGIINDLGMPVMNKKTEISCDDFSVARYNNKGETVDEKGPGISLKSISNIENNINILEGSLFSSDGSSDTIEGIISESTKRTFDLKVGETFAFRQVSSDNFVDIKITGVFQVDDKDNSYWKDGNILLSNTIVIPEDSLMKLCMYNNRFYLNSYNIKYALDYTNINISNLSRAIKTLDMASEDFNQKKNSSIHLAALDTLKEYVPKTKQLSITMWTIASPVILMIIIYIFMVSTLILEHDKDEISLLRSRGATKLQVLKVYLGENFILFFITVLVSPFVAYLLTRVFGATSGFLKFVSRPPLDIKITHVEWLYALVSAFAFLIIMFIPIVLSSKDSIVAQKRSKSRKGKSIWQRFYLDVVLLGIGLYSVYQFQSFESILNVSKVETSNLPISPFMYASFTILILGIGLLMLRVYPYFIKLILKMGKDRWSPSMYVCLTNITRSNGKNGFLMIFLILTLSTGIFNLKAASTINTMAENRIKYLNGADIVIRPWWIPAKGNTEEKGAIVSSLNPDGTNAAGVFYEDIDFTPYTKIDGIEATTKVLKSKNGRLNFNGNLSKEKTQLIGIIPDEFGRTAWFDSSILPYHWYNYLNLLSKEPKAILVSSQVADDLKLSKGSRVDVRFDGNLYMECYVGEIIDYWPSYDPNLSFGSGFVVMNLKYIDAMCSTQPYEIWMKTSSNASYNTIFDSIKENKVYYENIHLTYNDLVDLKTSPIIQGTNGLLSLSFIASLVITTLGFLIYWILSIKERTLDFGILRAMGLTLKKVITILINEQIFISGAAIIMGLGIGSFASNIFIPMVNLSTNPDEKIILPFKAVSYMSGYINLTIFMIVMLSISLLVLINIVKKLDLNQALKLGDD